MASGPALPQQHCIQGQRAAGSQAHQVGARVPLVPQGVHDGAELLSPSPARRAETPPPLGFNFNCGANFVPCIVTDNRGRGVPAQYTWVIMGPDPHVVGITPGDCSQYGGLLYAIPHHDQGEYLRCVHDNLWHFKYSTNKKVRFNSTLEFIHNILLTTEVTCFHKASHLFFQYQEDICKLEEHMCNTSQLKDASGHRLEGANALHRIEEALVELNCRAAVMN